MRRVIRHLSVRPGLRPAIILMGVVAGFWCEDVWQLVAALIAAAFIDVKPWDPYAGARMDKRKSKDASE